MILLLKLVQVLRFFMKACDNDEMQIYSVIEYFLEAKTYVAMKAAV